MLRRAFSSLRGNFVIGVLVTNLLSVLVAMFIWGPLSRRFFPAGHFLAPYLPMAIATALAIPISSTVSGRYTKPIQDMLEATKSISQGDYSVRVKEEGAGEMAELLRSFNRMTGELGSTELMRSDFTNNFSHEFKTPIVSIRGFAKRLRTGNLSPEKQEEYLAFIEEESQRLSNLASSVLLLAKYDSLNLVGEQTDFDLDEQIRTCVLRLENQWTAKGLRWDLDLPSLPYRSNAEMLDHVWGNLLSNAVKFSREGGSISITGRREGERIIVSIRDFGIGIPKEEQGHIFDKFYQADAAHASEGNGLGLPLVKRILELAGGHVYVQSQVGEGTTFTVELPGREQQAGGVKH